MIANNVIKNKLNLFLLIIPLLLPFVCFASDQIKVDCSISNLSNPTNITVEYDVIPDPSNPHNAENEPTSITLIVNENDKVINKKVNKKLYIDFKDTIYKETGLYKYLIQEKSLSNKVDYELTNKRYEIYVQAVYDSEGNIVKNILLYGLDLSDNEKKPVYFEYRNVNDEIIIDIPKTDMNVYRLPIVIFILTLSFIFIFLGKKRKYDQ